MSWDKGVDWFCLEHGFDVEDRRAMHNLLKQAYGFEDLNKKLQDQGIPAWRKDSPPPIDPTMESNAKTVGRLSGTPEPGGTPPPTGTPAPAPGPTPAPAGTTPAPTATAPAPASLAPNVDRRGAKALTAAPGGVPATAGYKPGRRTGLEEPDYASVAPARGLWDNYLSGNVLSPSNIYNSLSQGVGKLFGQETREEARNRLEREQLAHSQDNAQAGLASIERRLNDRNEAMRHYRANPNDPKSMEAMEKGLTADRARQARMRGQEPPPEVAAMMGAMSKGDFSGAAHPRIADILKGQYAILNDPKASPQVRESTMRRVEQLLDINHRVQDVNARIPVAYAEGDSRAVRNLVRNAGLPRAYFADRPEYQRQPAPPQNQPKLWGPPAKGQLPPGQAVPPVVTAPGQPTQKTPAAPTALPGRQPEQAAQPQAQPQPQPQPQPVPPQPPLPPRTA